MNNFFHKLFIIIVIVIINSPSGQTSFLSTLGTIPENQLTNKLQNDVSNDSDIILASIQIRVYVGTSIQSAAIIDVPITQPELIYQYIDQTKPLVIYTHGYREDSSDENIQTVVGAHLERGTDNIFLLNWSKLSYDNYITVISRIKDISRIFATSFNRLIELGLNIEDCHLVGHSLGGQLVGFVWKYTKYSLPRVTALDPAHPGFYHPGAEHIDRRSARFVDIIHTDGGFYGALKNTGTVDFFVNGGTRPQPGCGPIGIPLTPTDLCSHWRSWRYYAESVKNIYAFPATQCNSYLNYVLRECRNNRVIYMGYDVPRDANGSYYLMTNDECPFGENISH